MKTIFILAIALSFSLNIFSQTPDFTFSFTNGACAPDSVNFTNTSSGAVSYKWDFGDFIGTSTATNPGYAYSTFGTTTYTVILTAFTAGGDSASIAKNVIIYVKPMLFGLFIPSPICLGQTIELMDPSFPPSPTQAWDYGDGNTSTLLNPTHTFADTGTYSIELISTNICGSDTTSAIVKVSDNSPKPSIFFITASPTVSCPNSPIIFSPTTSYSKTTLWDLGDGDTSTDFSPAHLYTDSGIYQVRLIIDNGCAKDTGYKTITIDTSLVPNLFISTTKDTLCLGEELQFNTSITGNESIFWNFGDSSYSYEINPTYTFSKVGIYYVQRTATNTCNKNDIDTLIIVVDSNGNTPNASFNFNPFSACPNDLVEFDNISSDTNNVFWSFGDGTTSILVNPSHTYASAGSYDIGLKVYNACNTKSDSFTMSITIDSTLMPFAFYNLSPFPPVCIGTPIEMQNFSNNASSYYWDFGDGDTSTEMSPSHSYAIAGDYNPILKATNGCGKYSYSGGFGFPVTIVDNMQPIAMLSASKTNVCVNEDIFFQNNTNPWPFPNTSWDFGDGETSTSLMLDKAYSTPGTYNVRMISTSDCGADTIYQTIIVRGAKADFTNTVTCLGDSMTFTDASTAGTTGWDWSFGNGDTSSQQNPIYTYSTAGTYDVNLQINKGGCYSTITKSVVVAAPSAVSAGFTYTLGSNGNITFTDTSLNADTWNWNFGDGNTSNSQNPSHTYASNTTYTVTLTASNACGFNDVIMINITIVNVGIPTIRGSNASIKIYPNPVLNTAILEIESEVAGNTQIEIYDLVGKKVYSKNINVASGINKFTINTNTLLNGIYFTKIHLNNDLIINKFIKSNN